MVLFLFGFTSTHFESLHFLQDTSTCELMTKTYDLTFRMNIFYLSGFSFKGFVEFFFFFFCAVCLSEGQLIMMTVTITLLTSCLAASQRVTVTDDTEQTRQQIFYTYDFILTCNTKVLGEDVHTCQSCSLKIKIIFLVRPSDHFSLVCH